MISFKEFATVILKILYLVENVLRLDFQKIRRAVNAIKILGRHAQEFFVYADLVPRQRALVASNATENFLRQSNHLELRNVLAGVLDVEQRQLFSDRRAHLTGTLQAVAAEKFLVNVFDPSDVRK